MEKKIIRSERFPKPAGPYSIAVEAGGLVFVSGQVSQDASTGKIVGSTVAEQTERVLTNLKAILEEAGSSLDKVVKVTVFLSDISAFAEMNSVYARFFPKDQPARTTVQGLLAKKEYLVEIDAVAVK